MHSGPHGHGTGNCLPTGSRRTARGSHQGDDETAGPAASWNILADTARLPDYPLGWGSVGYWKADQFVTVATPPNLKASIVRPKEAELIDLIGSEKAKGRKVWVYVQYTDAHDVQGRLEQILQNERFRVGVLRSSVPLARREEWIAKHASQLDVVISHPRLVETGLDLFDKGGPPQLPDDLLLRNRLQLVHTPTGVPSFMADRPEKAMPSCLFLL